MCVFISVSYYDVMSIFTLVRIDKDIFLSQCDCIIMC